MMYLDFFGFDTKPFHTTPDPSFLYLSPSHKEALGSIVYGVMEKKGFILVTGQVGLGKTTILRSFLAHVDRGHQRTIYLLNPNLSFRYLLKTLLLELGYDPVEGDDAAIVEQLHMVLIEEYRNDRTVVLLIDEAQNMPIATLEHLRMLSNLETPKDKLIQIVLLGQPELDGLLARPELRQLSQRIAMQAVLRPLSKKESREYIHYRLVTAGGAKKTYFSRWALRLLVQEAQGTPRRLNILCDNALITALGYQQKIVTSRIAKEVIRDQAKRRFFSPWKSFPLSAGVLLFILAVTWLMPWGQDEISESSLLPDSNRVAMDKENQNPNIFKAEKVSEQERDHLTLLEASQVFPWQSMSKEGQKKYLSNDLPLMKFQLKNFPPILGRGWGIVLSPTYDTLNYRGACLVQDELIERLPNRAIADKAESRSHMNRSMNIKARLPEEFKTLKGHDGNYQANPEPRRSISKKRIKMPQEVANRFSPVLKVGEATHPLELQGEDKVFSKEIFAHSSKKTMKTQKKRMIKHDLFYDVSTVQVDDTVEKLAEGIYGSSHPLYVQRVLDYNPHILNPKEIIPGQHVFLPRGKNLSSVQSAHFLQVN